ncbi:HTTM domain-containing protein [Planctomycetota bacterium]|jgi:hypothetical protein|nr:HTTM domain-containing protein [Planctomycetota bacterium]
MSSKEVPDPSGPATDPPPAADGGGWLERAHRALHQRVDISSLVFFRIAFGAIMVWEVTRYYGYGWVKRYFIEPSYNFPYPLFDWVKPWPGDGMYYHFIFLGAMAFCVMVGLMYRLSAALLCLAFTYVFLLEEARYLNHFYLVCLLTFLLAIVPANRSLSVDARFEPALRSRTAPAWALWLLRFQVGIPYFFGGIAKLNSDWLHGSPMRYWLASRDDFPIIGQTFHHPFTAYFFSYSGLLIDLLAVPLLLWRRTRVVMFVVLVAFHFTNTRLFNIGIFPWTMMAVTTIFFPPDWPRRLVGDLRQLSGRSIAAFLGAALGAVMAAAFRGDWTFVPSSVGALAGMVIAWSLFPAMHDERDPGGPTPEGVTRARGTRLITLCVALWMGSQTLIPLRHYLIPGVVHWTEEGHRFSWHMKLRGKDGQLTYIVRNPEDGAVRAVNPGDRLEDWQVRKMATRPYMIRQYAQQLAREAEADGWPGAEVFVRSRVRLNGRPSQVMIDPEVDLARADMRYMAHNDWITQLANPLPKD